MPSQNYQSERFVEAKRYPSTDVQAPFSLAILVISMMVYFMKLDSNIMMMETLFLSSSAFIVFLIIGFPQVLIFRKIVKSFENGENNFVLKDGFSSLINTLSIFFLVLVIIGPFILSSFISPAEWFGSVLGIIIGFSLYQLLFPIYVKRWEKNKCLQLEYYEIWAYNVDNKKVVFESGVREKTALS